MSLYRRFRPQTFAEIVGQSQVSEPLLKQLETGRFSHAYLFSGPRGTGKTSTARIFAKAINCIGKSEVRSQVSEKNRELRFGEPCNKCGNCRAITEGRYLDVIEIDAASNRGIDEIRDLRDKIRLAPTTGRFKVYIIDEVHMLTHEAFNALLKTLEEPPEHAIFILATTEPQKVPATIVSRTQRFTFNKLTKENIQSKLQTIKAKDRIKVNEELLTSIAEIAEGAMRDAEVLLEKISVIESPEEQKKALGRSEEREVLQLLENLLLKKTKVCFTWVEDFVEKGGNAKSLTETVLNTLRDILFIKVGVQVKDIKYTPEALSFLENFAQQIGSEKLTKWITLFSAAASEIKDSPIPSLPLELAIVEACEFNSSGVGNEEGEESSEAKLPVGKVETQKPESAQDQFRIQKKGARDLKIEKVLEESEQEKQAPKSKTAGKQSLSIEGVQKNWTAILNKVKEANSSLGIFLRTAQPMDLDGDLLTLEVGYRFHKDRLEEPKNSLVLSQTIAEILGKPVRIKGMVNENRPKAERKKEDNVEETDPVEIFGKLN